MKKYKKLPLIIASLSGVALFSAGFAAWIIKEERATEITDFVDITVGECSDNRIQAVLSEPEAIIKFDSNQVGGKGLLKGDANNEDLQIGGKITVSFIDNVGKVDDVLDKFDFEVTVNETDASKLSTCLSSNYIETPFEGLDANTKKQVNIEVAKTTADTQWDAPSSTYLKTSYKYTATETTATLEFKFGFRWGTVFHNVNPCDDAEIKDDSSLKTAKEALTALKELDSLKGLLKIKVTPKLATIN